MSCTVITKMSSTLTLTTTRQRPRWRPAISSWRRPAAQRASPARWTRRRARARRSCRRSAATPPSSRSSRSRGSPVRRGAGLIVPSRCQLPYPRHADTPLKSVTCELRVVCRNVKVFAAAGQVLSCQVRACPPLMFNLCLAYHYPIIRVRSCCGALLQWYNAWCPARLCIKRLCMCPTLHPTLTYNLDMCAREDRVAHASHWRLLTQPAPPLPFPNLQTVHICKLCGALRQVIKDITFSWRPCCPLRMPDSCALPHQCTQMLCNAMWQVVKDLVFNRPMLPSACATHAPVAAAGGPNGVSPMEET